MTVVRAATKSSCEDTAYLLKVRGVSPYVCDTTASFYTNLDDVLALDPRTAIVGADPSRAYRRSRLRLGSTLRRTPVPLYDESLVVAPQMLADHLDYQLKAVRHALSVLLQSWSVVIRCRVLWWRLSGVSIFSGRRYSLEVILGALVLHLRHLLQRARGDAHESGVSMDHTTIFRWGADSWRVDETYLRIGGKWCYLYRDVTKRGDTLDFYLSTRRSTVSAKHFLAKTLQGMEAMHSLRKGRGERFPSPDAVNVTKAFQYL